MKKLDLVKICKTADRIGISGHVRPDGDCIGSTMGLYLYLKKIFPKKEIQIFLEQPADIFACIKDFNEINTEFTSDGKFDVFFAIDTAKERIGEAEKFFDEAAVTVNIDHHISNADGTGKYNYVDTQASSASELVYDLLEQDKIDTDIAMAIYIGIIHDTGVFQYSNTSPKTLQTAAKLISYGFDFSKLIDETFYEKSYVQNQILGRALLESILFMDGKCVVSCIDRKTMEFYNVTGKDFDGIVNQLRIIKGVECAVFMYETDTLTYKVSMRSCQVVDVAKVASFFGGGGHMRAAGCMLNGTFYDVVNNLAVHIDEQLKDKK